MDEIMFLNIMKTKSIICADLNIFLNFSELQVAFLYDVRINLNETI